MNIELNVMRIIGYGVFVFGELLVIYWILQDKKSVAALIRCDLRRCDSETLFLIMFVLLNALCVWGHINRYGLGLYVYRFGF